MSLDIYLELDNEQTINQGSGIFVREEGTTKEITREEWNEKFPDREPVVVNPEILTKEVYSANITHNLSVMAGEAGIYKELWRPEEIEITKAEQLIEPLADGLALLQSDPERFKAFNPSNGWGTYESLVNFVAGYLIACKAYPEANIKTWR